MAPTRALLDDKKRTTLSLPSEILAQAEHLAARQNSTVSAVVAQAMEAGMAILSRKERALETYERFRSALADLTDEERMLVDGIYLTPVEQLPAEERQ